MRLCHQDVLLYLAPDYPFTNSIFYHLVTHGWFARPFQICGLREAPSVWSEEQTMALTKLDPCVVSSASSL